MFFVFFLYNYIFINNLFSRIGIIEGNTRPAYFKHIIYSFICLYISPYSLIQQNIYDNNTVENGIPYMYCYVDTYRCKTAPFS